MFTTKTECRACGHAHLEPVIDFGLMPLANDLKPTHGQALDAERFPLALLLCSKCSLLQTSVVVSPEKLFSHYVYRSSMSRAYKKHCREMAVTLKDRFRFGENSFAVDIAGNDGALLREFKAEMLMPCVNIDPAANLCKISNDSGIPAKKKFWGLETAKWLFEPERQISRFTHADIITATNVFAHVDDIRDFLAGVNYSLSVGGVCVIEFPHVLDFLHRAEFDTIYHEHLSYFGLSSFLAAIHGTGLHVFDCEKFDIHGGTLRLYVCKAGAHAITPNVADMQRQERILFDRVIYSEFIGRTRGRLNRMRETLRQARTDEKKVYAFGASAKGNTFLNRIGTFANGIQCIIDETPEKIGLYAPGVGLPVVALDGLDLSGVDLVVNLVWNFRDDVEKKLRAAGYAGEIYHSA